MYKTAHASIFHIKVSDDKNIGPSNFLLSEGKKSNQRIYPMQNILPIYNALFTGPVLCL